MLTHRSLVRGAAAAAALLLLTGARAQGPLNAEPIHRVGVSDAPELALPAVMWVEDDPADALWRAAQSAISDGDFRRAARLFAEITSKHAKSAYSADALYWRAFALYKSGGDANLRDALDALATEKSKYPKAKTIGDADALAVRIRGSLAKRGDAEAAEEVSSAAQSSSNCVRGRNDKGDDIRSEAMNALLQMDAQSAVPILKDILAKRDGCSSWLRKQAVFMLSQHRTSETETLMMDAVRNDPSADVREAGVFWLGQVHSEKAEDLLIGIATTSRDTDLRKKAIFALTQQQMPRGQALIRRLADDASAPADVRKDAIWQLGQQRSQANSDALRALFARVKDDDDVAKSALFSLAQMKGYGNDRWLLNLATDRTLSEDVRKHAVWCAGQAGIPGSELISLYDRVSDRAIKEHLIWVMSDAHDRGALDKLVDIAKNDRDSEMRKKAIFWLGQKNDPRVRQLLIDIIKGE